MKGAWGSGSRGSGFLGKNPKGCGEASVRFKARALGFAMSGSSYLGV